MMICVQLDKRAEFDKLWRWVKKNMLYTSGKWAGYFAWQCDIEGRKIGEEPSCAPDGEAYFITSLFLLLIDGEMKIVVIMVVKHRKS